MGPGRGAWIGVCALAAVVACAARPSFAFPLEDPYTCCQASVDDIRTIAVVDDGFLAATGAGVVRFRYVDGVPTLAKVYTGADGLPSDNCVPIRVDARGAVWVGTQAGLACLAPGADRWLAFGKETGLPAGPIASLTLSANGTRIWVCTRTGLSTASVADRQWKTFARARVLSVTVHPTEPVAWCKTVVPVDCDCRFQTVFSELDCRTGRWTDLARTGHVTQWVDYCAATDSLWLHSGGGVPMRYDRKTGTTQSWPAEPRWRRTKGQLVQYSEWFGGAALDPDGGGRLWAATGVGFWSYDPATGDWTAHKRTAKPALRRPRVFVGRSGERLYWVAGGCISRFDMRTRRWDDLWEWTIPHHRIVHLSGAAITPTESHVWCWSGGYAIAGDLATRQFVALTDKDLDGLGRVRAVCFDPARSLALLATPRGVLWADYAGAKLGSVRLDTCPISRPVRRIVVSPDSRQAWCLLDRRSAAVFDTVKGAWLTAGPYGQASDVAFSPDGKTAWAVCGRKGRELPVVQRALPDGPWRPLRVRRQPESFGVRKLYPTPDGKELWLSSWGAGLLRVVLGSGKVTLYKRPSTYMPRRVPTYRIGGDYVSDVVFTHDGRLALASVGGGGDEALAVVNRETGWADSYSIERTADRLSVAADGSLVWCELNPGAIWAMDLMTRQWRHRFAGKTGLPIEYPGYFYVSPDARVVWAGGHQGMAVFAGTPGKWALFPGRCWANRDNGLRFLPDGRRVLCAHPKGAAILGADGRVLSVLEAGDGAAKRDVRHIHALSDASDYVCAMATEKATVLCRIDMNAKRVRPLHTLPGRWVRAMAVGPDRRVWAATESEIVCVHADTGRRVSLRGPGEPLTRQVAAPPGVRHSDGPRVTPVAAGARLAPRAPAPAKPASVPAAVNLKTEGLAAPFYRGTQIATTPSGRIYVLWMAWAQPDPKPAAGVPIVPKALLPAPAPDSAKPAGKLRKKRRRTPGVSVFDGRRWLPAQALCHGDQTCYVQFAWARGEELNVILSTEGKRTHHLAFDPATGQWTRRALPAHLQKSSFLASYDRAVGLVHSIVMAPPRMRVLYSRYDGRVWTRPIEARIQTYETLHAKRAPDGAVPYKLSLFPRPIPRMAGAPDGSAHIVWLEPGVGPVHVNKPVARVGHAVVRDGQVKQDIATLVGRGVRPRRFAVCCDGAGRLVMAYVAGLPDTEFGRDTIELRTWTDKGWSPPEQMAADVGSLSNEMRLVRGRDTLLFAWRHRLQDRSLGDAGWSWATRRADGRWSAPRDLCREGADGRPVDADVALHADAAGNVHAAWQHQERCAYARITSLAGKD